MAVQWSLFLPRDAGRVTGGEGVEDLKGTEVFVAPLADGLEGCEEPPGLWMVGNKKRKNERAHLTTCFYQCASDFLLFLFLIHD